jgi:CubicO group peptidase (beta-lactamase class C family)
MAQVWGYCESEFQSLRHLLEKNIESGEELGLSIAVNIDGKTVVDLYGGFIDEERTKPWEKNTIVNVWSSTKTIASLAALVLIDRGLLDPYEKVSKYWPEFAQNGKEGIEVRHFLSHTAGLSGWEKPITVEDIYNVRASAERLATQTPWWEPGTASGYHSLTMGHLIGELVQRITQKSLKQFIEEEIAGPLGADFQLGAKESDWSRVSTLIPPPTPRAINKLEASSISFRTRTGPAVKPQVAISEEWRAADIGAANGHGNARSLCRILSAITLGGIVEGQMFLCPKTINLIFQQQADGVDLVLDMPMRFGIGYGISGGSTMKSVPMIREGKVCFWSGWGGSMNIMDLDRRITISYVMNKMGEGTIGTSRTATYVDAVYNALK